MQQPATRPAARPGAALLAGLTSDTVKAGSQLNVRQISFLLLLDAAGGPLRSDEIAGPLGVKRFAVSRLCDSLEPAGFVRRSHDTPRGGGHVFATLMPPGRAYVAALLAPLMEQAA